MPGCKLWSASSSTIAMDVRSVLRRRSSKLAKTGSVVSKLAKTFAPSRCTLARRTSLTRSLQQLHARVAPEIEWIPQLGLSRNHPPATLERRLSPFLELEFYQTLDLYGDEFAQPIGAFKSLFRQAKDAGLRVKAHV